MNQFVYKKRKILDYYFRKYFSEFFVKHRQHIRLIKFEIKIIIIIEIKIFFESLYIKNSYKV